MTQTQIRYFITAAQCLNFTEAAKQLFITQPALSQQITAIENELNMQLFIRSKNKLRLTPAATVLLEELPKYERQFSNIIDKARVMSYGNRGILNIGVLEEQMLPVNFKKRLAIFREKHPEIYLKLYSRSFGDLRDSLNNKQMDIILTPIFDVEHDVRFLYERLAVNEARVVVSKYHPATKKSIQRLSDLKNETFVLVNDLDSVHVKEMVLADCKKEGFIPNLLMAENMREQSLWIEAGLGIGIISANSYICIHPDTVCLNQLKLKSNYFVLAWDKDNLDPNVALFVNEMCFEEYDL